MHLIFAVQVILVGTAMCFPSPNLKEIKVPEGYVLVQGDIMKETSNLRNANIRTGKWANGLVPYTFQEASKYTQNEKDFITSTMKVISQATNNCIRFTPRTTQTGYIEFSAILGGGCWSHVGNLGRPQNISIDHGCIHQPTIIHELLHSLGFEHEQLRPDRDDYVRVLTENVAQGTEIWFKKYDTATVDTMGMPYDYYSIMHYWWGAFSKNGKPTILTLDPKVDYKKLGQSTEMTYIDTQKLLKLYNCPSTQVYKVVIKSLSANKYLCADNYGNKPLIASADVAQLWETFDLFYNKDETVSIRAKVNNKFIRAQNNGNDVLITNSDSNLTLEKFYMYRNSDATYSFKAFINGKYVSVLSDSKLRANATLIGTPEKFIIEFLQLI